MKTSCSTRDGSGDPFLPADTCPQGPAEACSFRPFGRTPGDLELDFKTEDRPELVTQVLSACLCRQGNVPPDSEQVWNLSISRRIECLLRLALASGDFAGHIGLHCPQNGCRQALEINLPIAEILDLQCRAEEREFLEWKNETELLQLRRPTGTDQINWRRAAFASEADARAALLTSLLVDPESAGPHGTGPQRSCWPDALESQLEEFDPLVAFSVRILCPHCEVESDFPIDLEALALNALEKIQQQIFREIHQLAEAYHWSEAEILRLTPQRRARYLKLIEEVAP